MAESNGSGDPIVIVQNAKNQVTFSKGGVPVTASESEYVNTAELPHAYTQDGDSTSANCIEIIVYFPDNTGVLVKVRDGQNIEAGELFDVVKDVKGFPDEAREAFSLWLVSDLLELQLKQNHVPFKLVCYWEELLEKYTTASEEHQQRDEPVIMFRRNVFYPLADEQKINETTLLRFLYWEAKKNILDGRYVLSQEECDSEAGIQAVITTKETENEQLDRTFGTAPYFKSRLAEYLPQHCCRRHWIYKTRENPERRLAEAYTRARNAYGEKSLDDLYHTYLRCCQKLPYYGSAFFRGQAEHPVKGIVSKVLSTKDDPVYVAINLDGVFIVDMDDVVLLIGFFYENLSWQFVESAKNDNANCLPCLFLQFPSEERSNETKILQIFSREAVLMDNLIEACVGLKRNQNSRKSPAECHVINGKGSLAEAFSRLALMTFNASGERINTTVRRPKQAPVAASAAV